ncbi:MAG: hypothetical protein LQ343_001589 [Gyalolechia ehrenbergii]|nr:MAG: hypothetical protein LQ343_001589 [Gyalolechia ehrenbergii]
MVGVRAITLVAMLAAVVACTRTNIKRASTTSTVIFRTDLKEGEGQSDRYKDLICNLITYIHVTNGLVRLTNGNVVSTVANNNTDGGYEISFVSKCEKDLAAGGIVKSRGIPLTTNTTGTVTTSFMNIGTVSDAQAPQPVTLSEEQKSLGFLYETGGELKLHSTMPPWDTWIICDGDIHPELSWVGVVQGLVKVPADCSAVRLFAMKFADLEKSVEGQC